MAKAHGPGLPIAAGKGSQQLQRDPTGGLLDLLHSGQVALFQFVAEDRTFTFNIQFNVRIVEIQRVARPQLGQGFPQGLGVAYQVEQITEHPDTLIKPELQAKQRIAGLRRAQVQQVAESAVGQEHFRLAQALLR